jgi:hypothetical membrane protein
MVLGTSIITQIMLQTGENVRANSVDLSDQVPGSDDYFNSLVLFPDGLPPFISSGGVYSPEITIFNIGFKIAGVLFILIGLEVFLRTASSLNLEDKKERKYNNLSLVCSTISGLSLFLITFFPFDKKLILHIIFASLIFICLAVWVISFMISRNKIDSEIEFRGQNLNEIRRKVVFFGVFSFIFMIVFVSLRMQSVGAIGEWCLMIAGQIQTLTFIPNLNNEK